jgi:peptide/nickel transport system substrate-binding protein
MARLGSLFRSRPYSPMRALALSVTVVLAFSACGTSAEPTQQSTAAPTQESTATPTQGSPVEPTQGPSAEPTQGSTFEPTPSGPQPQRGGTLYLLVSADNQFAFASLDPTVVYTGMDGAFLDATLMRSLVSYTYSPATETADTLQPDLATDAGTPNANATQWTFNLRDGPKWQDGSKITCADIKYGISRAFAFEVFGDLGGPTYAIQDLDIPADPNAVNGSQYPGPYTATSVQQALYDRAVVCDANTITFHLNRTVADFNYATTLGMFPVKQSADTGDSYAQAGSPPPNFLSSGPYQIKSYAPGNGGSLVLERNPYWNPASDPVRKALPDSWEVDFGLDPVIVDQRLMASTGDDAMAVMYGSLQQADVPRIFADPHTPNPAFAGRAFSAYGPGVYYHWINTQKVPNVLQRQAIAVAYDRDALLGNAGGPFFGDLADGVIPPNMGVEYAPTGWATDLFKEPVPPEGNPDLARRLIERSGVPMPDPLTWDHPENPVLDKNADVLINSLEQAGITVTARQIVSLKEYWAAVGNDDEVDGFGWSAWRYDWPNASTIIPPLFTDAAGFNLSRVHDQDFLDQVQDALTTVDRTAQAAKWQDLNREAMQRAYVVPLFNSLVYALGGTRVGPLYLSGPFSLLPFAEMGVLPE